jgi:hypothetical protein
MVLPIMWLASLGRVSLGCLTLVSIAGRAWGQAPVERAACRDPHSAPVCGSYFLFEFNAAGRVAGTELDGFRERKPALTSWFAWDIGWMKNTSSSASYGAALEIGASDNGTRVAARVKHRQWLAHDVVIDASAGPLMAMVLDGAIDGNRPTYGATADVGVGRARIGLVTLGVDAAKQVERRQLGFHVGAKLESRAVGLASLVAAAGGLNVIAALSSGSSY